LFPEILADESVDFGIIRTLRERGVTIVSIAECSPGIGDRKVLEIARQRRLLLLTEDSDFGELIFAFKEPAVGVMFLRYHFTQRNKIAECILGILNKSGNQLLGAFTVITPEKIRLRFHL